MNQEECVEAFKLIGAITGCEGDSVTIHSGNPDFQQTDEIDFCVSVVQNFGDAEYFYGASIVDALRKAVKSVLGGA